GLRHVMDGRLRHPSSPCGSDGMQLEHTGRVTGPIDDAAGRCLTTRQTPGRGSPVPVGGNESSPGPAAPGEPLLELDDLTVGLEVAGTRRAVLRGVSLAVDPGESVGLVGESGSGKTMTARAVSRLLPPGAELEGQIRFGGRDVATLRGGELRSYRNRISMVFQDPRAHINPVRRIGDFMTEALRTNLGVSGPEARRRAADALRQVGIDDGERRVRPYPRPPSRGGARRGLTATALRTR